MKRSEPKATLPTTELWSEFDYYASDRLYLSEADRVTSHKGNKKFWKEFNTTPAWERKDQEATELAESLEFKLSARRILDEAFIGNNDHPVYLDRSKYIAEQLGLANDETDPTLLEKAHQAYYLAFRFADVDFIEDSRDVEGVFNQRALTVEEFQQVAVHARERLDADPEWERKLYTSLPLFTETPAERQIAVAVFSTAIAEIAHWEMDQSSIGEVKRLGLWHLRQRFGAIASEIAQQDTSWAKKVDRLEAGLQAASESSKS